MGLPASRLPPPRCFAGRFLESLPCPDLSADPAGPSQHLVHLVRKPHDEDSVFFGYPGHVAVDNAHKPVCLSLKLASLVEAFQVPFVLFSFFCA